jgi:hypothetical protein
VCFLPGLLPFSADVCLIVYVCTLCVVCGLWLLLLPLCGVSRPLVRSKHLIKIAAGPFNVIGLSRDGKVCSESPSAHPFVARVVRSFLCVVYSRAGLSQHHLVLTSTF